jgi:hypothetical protein
VESQKERALGRSRIGLVENNKIDLGEIELGGMECIDPAQDREQWGALAYTIMTLWVP